MGTSAKGNKMTKGNNFVFGKDHGFSASCGGTVVSGYMRGGHAKKAKGGDVASSEPVYPEAGTPSKPEGYAKGGGNFIKGAIKHPGALHREMGVPQGKKIPAKRLEKAAHAGGKLGERARFAETLEHLRKAKGGKIESKGEAAEGEKYEEAAKGGHMKSTPKPYAYGGRMPGAVAGAHHRSKVGKLNPLVSALGSSLKAPMASPMANMRPPMPAMSRPPVSAPTSPPMMGGMAKGGKK